MSSRRKRLLEEAAASRKNNPPVETEDITRVYDRFFGRSQKKEAQESAPVSPLPDKGPSLRKRPAPNDGPSKQAPLALQNDGPLADEGPSPYKGLTPDFSLLNSLPDVDGFLFWFHQLTDYLCRQLSPPEQALYLQLYRLSWGFGSPRCIVGFPKLAERSGMSESGARLAATGLIKKGLVRKLGMVFGKNREQGIEWEVYEPPALTKFRTSRSKGPLPNTEPSRNEGPSRGTPIKEINTQKENTQTQEGVSVASRFTFDQCRAYADHLKKTGQGITNPGGYATKIYRTGEADELIAAWSNPTPALDIGQCPDCGGSGFVYIDPLNLDKGVNKCRHERLRHA